MDTEKQEERQAKAPKLTRPRTGSLYRRGNVWWLRFMVDGKRAFHNLHTESKEDAERQQAELMRPLQTAEKADVLAVLVQRLNVAKAESEAAADEQHPPLTVADAWAVFVKAANRPDSGPATLATYELQWGCFVRWLYGEPPKPGKKVKYIAAHPEIKFMREVSKDIAGEYAASMTGRGVTPNTYNKHVRVCGLVFRVLKDKAKTTENPWLEIERKRLVPQSRRELTTVELRTVCQAAAGELRVLLAVGLYIGARLADAATLEWSQIDLARGFIRYTPRKTARMTGRTLTVPLHPGLLGILSETLPAKRRGPVLPRLARIYERKGPWAVSRIVQAHFVACGITTTREGKGVRRVVSAGFHSLRHSAVSLLREAGAPLSVTMAIVGHSSLAIHDTYTHTGEAAMRRAVASLPSMMDEGAKGRKLLPGRTPAAALQAGIAKIESMKAKTWGKVRAAALDDLREALGSLEGSV